MTIQLQEPQQLTHTVTCQDCQVKDFCMPANASESDMAAASNMVQLRRKIKKGSRLFKVGTNFHAVFNIRTGFFKTTNESESGEVNILGFHMQGNSLGLDGFSHNRYLSDAVALEDSEVCVIPYEEIEQLSRQSPQFQRHFLQRLTHEFIRGNSAYQFLNKNASLERVASFIQLQSHQFRIRGFSRHELLLRMSRIDMADYLGLTKETVSRSLAKLISNGLIAVKLRHVRILNEAALLRLTGNQA